MAGLGLQDAPSLPCRLGIELLSGLRLDVHIMRHGPKSVASACCNDAVCCSAWLACNILT